jgi:hypothetical protein
MQGPTGGTKDVSVFLYEALQEAEPLALLMRLERAVSSFLKFRRKSYKSSFFFL